MLRVERIPRFGDLTKLLGQVGMRRLIDPCLTKPRRLFAAIIDSTDGIHQVKQLSFQALT
jgi:hypothetical protein